MYIFKDNIGYREQLVQKDCSKIILVIQSNLLKDNVFGIFARLLMDEPSCPLALMANASRVTSHGRGKQRSSALLHTLLTKKPRQTYWRFRGLGSE